MRLISIIRVADVTLKKRVQIGGIPAHMLEMRSEVYRHMARMPLGIPKEHQLDLIHHVASRTSQWVEEEQMIIIAWLGTVTGGDKRRQELCIH